MGAVAYFHNPIKDNGVDHTGGAVTFLVSASSGSLNPPVSGEISVQGPQIIGTPVTNPAGAVYATSQWSNPVDDRLINATSLGQFTLAPTEAGARSLAAKGTPCSAGRCGARYSSERRCAGVCPLRAATTNHRVSPGGHKDSGWGVCAKDCARHQPRRGSPHPGCDRHSP